MPETDVSVIGLGRMGAAVARTLVAAGRSVTVWNRTATAAESLVAMGARAAPTPASAIAASPLSILIVLDYAAGHEILKSRSVSAAISNRTLVQLSSGTPAEAKLMSSWAENNDARYVDGYPMCFETSIGTPAGLLLYAGAHEAVAVARPYLDPLGETIFVGLSPASSNAVLIASVALYQASVLGFLQGSAIAQAAGVPAAAFGELMGKFVPALAEAIDETGQRLAGRKSISEPRSSVSNNVALVPSMLEACQELGVSTELPLAFARQFEAAERAGLVGKDVAAMLPLFFDSEQPRALAVPNGRP